MPSLFKNARPGLTTNIRNVDCARRSDCLSRLGKDLRHNRRGRYRKEIGGADGVRTHDLLDAIEARSQLRHGPTELFQFTTGRLPSSPPTICARPPCNLPPTLQVLLSESKLFTGLLCQK